MPKNVSNGVFGFFFFYIKRESNQDPFFPSLVLMLKRQGEKDSDLSCQNSPSREEVVSHPLGNIQQLMGTCHHGVAKPEDDR